MLLPTPTSENPPQLTTTARRDYRLKMLYEIGPRRASQKECTQEAKKRPHKRDVFKWMLALPLKLNPRIAPGSLDALRIPTIAEMSILWSGSLPRK
jgi:hypothetical protein